MFAIHFLYGPGAHGDEYLDRPPSNFDVGGIPQGKWSSGLFACHQNIMPSCFMSFFCPCIMFGQVSNILCKKHLIFQFLLNYVVIVVIDCNPGTNSFINRD